MSLLDLLFPKHCVGCKKNGEYLCSSCFTTLSFDVNPKCIVCGKMSFSSQTHPICKGKYTIDGVFCGLLYKGIMKKLIYTFKYKPFLTDLTSLLTDLLYESLMQQEFFHNLLSKKNIFLIPIPLSREKMRKRGYNQTHLLAKSLGKRLEIPIKEFLQRQKDTKPQFGLKKEERIQNIKNAFKINTRHAKFISASSPKIAFLIDDVLTTGTTLLEAAKVLKKNGFMQVWGICLAQD